MGSGSRFQALGIGAYGLGIWGLEFRELGSGLRVQDLGFWRGNSLNKGLFKIPGVARGGLGLQRVRVSGFRVEGLGLRG